MKVLRIFSWLLLLFLWSPLFFLLLKGLRADAFTRLLANDDLLLVFSRSLLLAASACIISTILATLTAFAIPSLGRLGKAVVEFGIILPMVLPEIAFGISYLVWFTKVGVPLGWTTLILAHVAFTFSYAVMVMKTSVEKIEWNFLDAAKDLGAGKIASFRHAILPQLIPGLVASSVMAFSLSLDDFLISFFVKGIDQVTLPIKVYSMMRHNVGAEIYALSIVLFCISVISVLMSQVWFIKSKSRA